MEQYKKDIKTGDIAVQEYTGLPDGDGLYWRITDNDILGFFNLSGFTQDDIVGDKKEKQTYTMVR